MRIDRLSWPLGLMMLLGCGSNEPAAPPGAKGPGAVEQFPPLPPPPADQTVREPAKVGVGEKGRDLSPGPVATPIQAMFRTQERLAFLQLVQPMNLYRAEHGHYPKTQEEFTDKIVKANRIELPKLPPGAKYVYDPQKAAQMSSYDEQDPPLFVERSQ